MSSLAAERKEPQARSVGVSDESLTVAPLAWFPRLWHGTAEERKNFELFGDGTYIHWPDLDEDLTIAGLVAGLLSNKAPQSVKKWLEARRQGGPDAK
jgi:hypothetical protein